MIKMNKKLKSSKKLLDKLNLKTQDHNKSNNKFSYYKMMKMKREKPKSYINNVLKI